MTKSTTTTTTLASKPEFDRKPLVDAIKAQGKQMQALFLDEALRTAKLFAVTELQAFVDDKVSPALLAFIKAHQTHMMAMSSGSPRKTFSATFGDAADATYRVYSGRSSKAVASFLSRKALPDAVTPKDSLAKMAESDAAKGVKALKGKKSGKKAAKGGVPNDLLKQAAALHGRFPATGKVSKSMRAEVRMLLKALGKCAK